MEEVYTQDVRWLDLTDAARLMTVKIAMGVDFELRGDRVYVHLTREHGMLQSEFDWLRAHKPEVVTLLARETAGSRGEPEARQ